MELSGCHRCPRDWDFCDGENVRRLRLDLLVCASNEWAETKTNPELIVQDFLMLSGDGEWVGNQVLTSCPVVSVRHFL